MKVRVEFTVEIDPKAWALEYGLEPSDVRGHVKDSAAYWAQAQIEQLGLQ